MNGLICFYSGSGNTKLACEYIARNAQAIRLDLFDIVSGGKPDLTAYGIVGFATFTDFFGPPMLMKTFLQSLPAQRDKPAFLFNTYGAISGKTLWLLNRWAGERGFRPVASHSLHTPENYPPMIARGRAFADAPNSQELAAFDGFVAALDAVAREHVAGQPIRSQRPRSGFFRFLPAFPRTQSRRAMGTKHVDAELCTECGICKSACPYGAIELGPKPVFDSDKCYGCWACYNHCPTKAIYTKKLRGVGHYPRPSAALSEKLGS